jgi:RimJ/RimL family protein N-acetyltransferase
MELECHERERTAPGGGRSRFWPAVYLERVTSAAPIPALEPAPADDRVALRRWRAADVPQLVAACADPLIQHWTRVPAGYGEADARAFLAGSATRWEAGESAEVAVVDAADETRLLGSVGLVRIEWERATAEIGYWVAPAARRQGVAARAVELLTAWTFATLPIARMELMPYVGNDASAAVARRAGYTLEGSQPARNAGPHRDVLLFARSRP